MAAAADWGSPAAEGAEEQATVYLAEAGRVMCRLRMRSTWLQQ